MITEEYLCRSHLFRHLKNEPHGQIVELYAARLVKDELADASTRRRLKLVAELFSWIKRCGLTACLLGTCKLCRADYKPLAVNLRKNQPIRHNPPVGICDEVG
jgi:hypothetical protein